MRVQYFPTIFLRNKKTYVCFFRAASLESSRYLVLSITATVVFLVLKDWSEEVVLFLSRAVRILTQTITLPKFNMEPKSDGFQKESLIPGCHFQIIFRFHVKLWEVIQKVSESAGITWWSRVMQDKNSKCERTGTDTTMRLLLATSCQNMLMVETQECERSGSQNIPLPTSINPCIQWTIITAHIRIETCSHLCLSHGRCKYPCIFPLDSTRFIGQCRYHIHLSLHIYKNI